MSRNQLNVRVTPVLESAIDAKRIELARLHGTIPTRSDVVRLALESYLGVSLDTEADQRRSAARAKRKTRR